MREKVVYSLKYILGDKKEISIPFAVVKAETLFPYLKKKRCIEVAHIQEIYQEISSFLDIIKTRVNHLHISAKYTISIHLLLMW